MSAPIGLVLGMPASAYHADTDSVSNTMLSSMNKSPAHCWALHLDPQRPQRTPTAAMLAGTIAHTAILEPDNLAREYVVKPADIDYRTKDGRAWRDAQTATIITAEDLLVAEQQRAAVMRVPALRTLLESGDSEASVFWRDQATGLRCRARPDKLHWHNSRSVSVLDIKSINDLTLDSVQRAIATYGYHRQEAHYTAGMRAAGFDVQEFVFGFVSSSYPYLAAAYVLDDETKQQGADEVGELLALFAECKRSGKWPAFGDGYQLAGLPGWAKRTSEVEVTFV